MNIDRDSAQEEGAPTNSDDAQPGDHGAVPAVPADPAVLAVPADGDHVAIIGENRKLLCFPISEVAEMGRGKGVKLQSYKGGGLQDVAVFNGEAGPEWVDGGGRRRNWPDWKDWLGKRAGAGRQGPRGLRKFR